MGEIVESDLYVRIEELLAERRVLRFDLARAVEVLGEYLSDKPTCTCSEDYTRRELHDPNCCLHRCWDDEREARARALLAALAKKEQKP